MLLQTRRTLSKTKALQPIYRVLRPVYYKYVKKRPWINYDDLEVLLQPVEGAPDGRGIVER